ncbi:MAG: Ig-like domain-containing protein [Acidimicrobiales bacterium]
MNRRGLLHRSAGSAATIVVALLVIAQGGAAAATPNGPPTSRAPSSAQTAKGGYWEVTGGGRVTAYGAAGLHAPAPGGPGGPPPSLVVGMAATPTSQGYWLVTSSGAVLTYGDATSFGSLSGQPLASPIVGMAATPDGQGYWLVSAAGDVYPFGDAGQRGSLSGSPASPIAGMAATPTGNGYWLVARDGSVFAFGDATQLKPAAGNAAPTSAVVGIAADVTGSGFWLVAAHGDVVPFGDAGSYGSAAGRSPASHIVGMAATPDGQGYWEVAADGTIYSLGNAGSFGHATNLSHGPKEKVVGMAPVGATVGGRVLLVGSYHGHRGKYRSIQAAVNAARPGDWILIGPGDYHPHADLTSPPTSQNVGSGWYGGVQISTPDLHIRGMNRSSVIVDGTKPGSPACSSNPADQQFGPTVAGKTGPVGQNGIVVWKANNVSIQNLTVCNFLAVNGNGGNEIWWNGGSGSGRIGMAGYSGSYLSATTTFDGKVNGVHGYGNYGIFSNSAAGPGVWNQIYASNFEDSGMYIGACQQQCDAWIHNAWMENSALGYSGTNSGGILTVDHSQFDNNEDGFDTNTQSAGDPPPPQNGTCPNGGVSALTHTTSCWVFMQNDVHNNNNPNAPGYQAVGQPTGTGMTVSGATNDTVMNNVFANNGAWGTLFVPFPDTSPGGPGVCTGSGGHLALGACIYDPEGDALLNNTYTNNGFFGNPSNGDFGEITFFTGEPQNCFAGNVMPNGSSPSNLEQTQPTCGALTTQTVSSGQLGNPSSLINQVLCDTGFASSFGQSCTPTQDKYPTPASNAPILTAVPTNLPTMPDPCAGVPSNAWCPATPSSTPTTSVVVPANGAALQGDVVLDASASSPTGIRSVHFVLSGGQLQRSKVIATATATSDGYLAGFDSATVPNGTYSLESVATSANGSTATSAPIAVTVVNPPLGTRILVPSSGALTQGSVLDAVAFGPAPIRSVHFELSGQGLVGRSIGTAQLTPYGWIARAAHLNGVRGGSYTLQSVVVDARGASATSQGVVVHIVGGRP